MGSCATCSSLWYACRPVGTRGMGAVDAAVRGPHHMLYASSEILCIVFAEPVVKVIKTLALVGLGVDSIDNDLLSTMHHQHGRFQEGHYWLLPNVWSKSNSKAMLNLSRELLMGMKMVCCMYNVSLKEVLLRSCVMIEDGSSCPFVLPPDIKKPLCEPKQCTKSRLYGWTGCENHRRLVHYSQLIRR